MLKVHEPKEKRTHQILVKPMDTTEKMGYIPVTTDKTTEQLTDIIRKNLEESGKRD